MGKGRRYACLQQDSERRCPHWTAEKVALALVTMLGQQKSNLLCCFDALRNNALPEAFTHGLITALTRVASSGLRVIWFTNDWSIFRALIGNCRR